MKYAPIIIPTLCRYEHFKKCIESLSNNTWAYETEVYIGVDYPVKDEHWDGYNKICDYLENANLNFKKVNVIKRTSNYGAIKNYSSLFDLVKTKHDRYILTEDDNVFSSCFIEYIDKMLEKTKSDDGVFAVCGYSYPTGWNVNNESFLLGSAFPAWGYGSFFSKYDKFKQEYNHSFLLRTLKETDKIKKIKKLSRMLFFWYVNRVWTSSVAYNDIDVQLYEFFTEKSSVLPSVSLVRNMGWDGSGVNCDKTNYNFSNQNMLMDSLDTKLMNIGQYDYNNEIKAWEFIDSINDINSFFIIKSHLKYVLLKMGFKH